MEKKRAKQFFWKHTNSGKKNVGKKIVCKKGEKRFLYSHEYRDHKMGGKKRAKQFFQEHIRIVQRKMLGKKSSGKSAKQRFLYSHEYRDHKLRRKKA